MKQVLSILVFLFFNINLISAQYVLKYGTEIRKIELDKVQDVELVQFKHDANVDGVISVGAVDRSWTNLVL